MAIAFYKDLPLDFTPHPVSGDIRPITNEVAIKRALKNLILTERGTKPFKPQYGSNVRKYLFANADRFTKRDIEENIRETVDLFEPRISLQKVNVSFEEDQLKITLDYIIRNIGQQSQLSFTIKRTA